MPPRRQQRLLMTSLCRGTVFVGILWALSLQYCYAGEPEVMPDVRGDQACAGMTGSLGGAIAGSGIGALIAAGEITAFHLSL